jgi:hypothetical protein
LNRLTSQWGVCGTFDAQETFIVNSEQARQQAEKRFKQEERARDGRRAMIEYEAEAVATPCSPQRAFRVTMACI